MADETFHASNERQVYKLPRGMRDHEIIHMSVMGTSFRSRSGEGYKLSVAAFKGYAPFYERPREGVLNNRSSSLRWAEQLLQGIREDDPELCAVALSHDGANTKVTVTSRAKGAPMRFDTSGFYTEEQMNENESILSDFIHKRVEKAQLFVTDNEWKAIHQYIKSAGCYSDPRFKLARAGDSALMMAVRLRSFKAAKYLLQSGVDAALKNEKAETVAMVVESKFEEILNERNHIRFLRVQAKSVRQMALSQADHTALASEPMIMDQIEQSYDLCMTLSKLFEIRLVNVQLVKIKKKLMEVEGLTLTEAELCELDSEQTIIESKALCEKLAESVVFIVAEWDGSKLAAEQRKKKIAADAVSKKQARVNYWKDELFTSAIKIQAVWRGCTVRYLLEMLRLHRGCVYVQCRTRGYLTRCRLRHEQITSVVVMMQSVGRGFVGRKKAARRANRVYPAKELVEKLLAANNNKIDDDDAEHQHTPVAEYVRVMFEAELDAPKLTNVTAQPKGQWAMLRYMGQRKALEEAKKSSLDDRKNGKMIGKLAMICLEHGTADSNFTEAATRKAFTKVAAALFEKADKAKHDEHGLFYRKRGDALFKSFTLHSIELEHEYLFEAIDAYEKSLKFIEVTVSPDVWLDKATAQSYTGDFEAAIKTTSAMVRKFPNFNKLEEVSMLAASLHFHQNEFAKAAAYVHHASIKGRGASYYSQMDLIMIAGRINEKWYEFLDKKINEREEESSEQEDESEDDVSEEPEEGKPLVEVDDEEEIEKDAKWDASEKAYKTVFRHYLAHKNVFHKMKYESWVSHPATWIRMATRAAKSGHYVLAEDLYDQALDRCGWWRRYRLRDSVEDLDELAEEVSSGSEGERGEEGPLVETGGDDEGSDAGSFEEEEEEEEEGEVHHEHEIHSHDLKEGAVRVLFEIAKCKYYQDDMEGARQFLRMAKDEGVILNSQGHLDEIRVASECWAENKKGELAKDIKLAYPKLVASIPQL